MTMGPCLNLENKGTILCTKFDPYFPSSKKHFPHQLSQKSFSLLTNKSFHLKADTLRKCTTQRSRRSGGTKYGYVLVNPVTCTPFTWLAIILLPHQLEYPILSGSLGKSFFDLQ